MVRTLFNGGIGGMLAMSRTNGAGDFVTHYFYHADGNGNITALANTNQTLSATYRYDPFGTLIFATGSYLVNSYRFSSKDFHGVSGLYYYGYRWYHPQLQRWLNRDPIGKAKGQNFFKFNGNDSMNFIDPWGHMRSTGKPHQDDGRASIVCDGKGGIRIYYPPGKQPKNPKSCEAKCLVVHEESHKLDALNYYPDICKGQADGVGIVFDNRVEQAESEIRASSDELACLDECNPPCDPRRKKAVEDYKKKYEKMLKDNSL